MASAAIPSFYLYGESPRAVDARFLHVEELDDRSRPSEWTILPHVHPDLHQLFFIRSGAGAIVVEGETRAFTAPRLLLVPAGAVHGFSYEADSAGVVLTVAAGFLEQLHARAPELGRLFDGAAVLDAAPARTELDGLFATLQRELSWIAPGHAPAVEACMLSLLVLALRLSAGSDGGVGLGPQAELVARFRASVGANVRRVRPLEAYDRDLGVPLWRLRAACRVVTGRSPLALVQERRMLEARRLLAYSTLGVAQIAYALGMEDAAYFSRQFARTQGASPLAYRRTCARA